MNSRFLQRMRQHNFFFYEMQKLNLKDPWESMPISVTELWQALPATTHYGPQLLLFHQNHGFVQGGRECPATSAQISSPCVSRSWPLDYSSGQ